jgi:hypothetical protein
MQSLFSLVIVIIFTSFSAQAIWLSHLDFDGDPTITENHGGVQGKHLLYEDNNVQTHDYFWLMTNGSGVTPQLFDWGTGQDRTAIQFYVLQSQNLSTSDRSELNVDYDVQPGVVHHLRFRLKVHSDGYGGSYFLPATKDEWTIITQIQQQVYGSSPSLSLEIKKYDGSEDVNGDGVIDPAGHYLQLVARTKIDGVKGREIVAQLNLADTDYFRFDNWVRVLISFKMGSDGMAQLWVSKDASLSNLNLIGEVADFDLHDNTAGATQEWGVKLGLYRGYAGEDSGYVKKQMFLHFDDIEYYNNVPY